MNRYLKIYLVIGFFGFASLKGQISGSVSGTWDSTGNPYYITGQCTIATGNTLTIGPGVQIYFQVDSSFIVQGTLNVNGTSADSVLFTVDSESTSEFAGIRFSATSSGLISYAKIEYGKANGTLPNDSGGAIYFGGSSIIISHCDISNCSANSLGGGIAIASSSATVENCRIHNNSANYGGGIWSGAYDTIIRNNYIYSNMVTNAGGGFHATGNNNNPKVEKNLFYNNSAQEGGGIGFNAGNEADVVNNIFYNNTATRNGGGVQVKFHDYGSHPRFFNNIIWNNSAATEGSQIYIEANSTLDIDYCDVAGDSINIANYGTLNYGSNNINLNPMFEDSLAYDFHLLRDSPCIDAGKDTLSPPSTDFDGNPAPQDGNNDGLIEYDIGAYEYINTVPQIISTPVESVSEDNVYSYQVVSEDPDEGDALTYSLTQSPTFLSINSSTGLISGATTNNDVGDQDITIQVADLNNATDTQVFTLFVLNTNDAPVVSTPIPDQQATEDVAYSYTFPVSTFSDVDVGDNLSYIATLSDDSALPGWLSFTGSTRTFSGTPGNADVGTITVKLTATDDSSASVSDEFDLEVVNVNDSPVISDIPDQTINEGRAFAAVNLDNYVEDIDNADSELTWNYSGNTDLIININPVTRVAIISTPNSEWYGSETITFTVTDPGLLTDSDNAVFTVNSVNDAPVVVNDAATTDEDVAVVIDVLANDSDSDGSLVPASVTVTGGPSNGGTSVNTITGEVTYTPAAGWSGIDSFTYTVEDDSGAVSNEATVTVTVSSVNDPTVAVDDAAGTNEDVAVEIDVLANDSDSDGSLVPSSVTVTGGPTNGGTSVNTGTGAITYTPTAGWYGVDTFTYTVEDDSGAVSNEATVTVTVGSVNDPPVAVDDAASTDEDVAVTTDVLANDSDLDGSLVPTSVTVTGGPSNGSTVVNSTTGAVTYTPNPEFFGIDTFTYTVEDDSGAVSNETTVTITVNSVNDPPAILTLPELTFNEDDSLVYSISNLYDYVTDPDHPDSVLIYVLNIGNYVTVIPDSPNVILKAPANWFGSDTLELIVLDPGLSDDTAQVFITVNSVNDAPVFVNWPDTIQFINTSDTSLTMNNYVIDNDLPGDSLHWQFSTNNDKLNLQFDTGTSELTLTAPDYIGLVTLYCTVTDDSFASITDSFFVKVIADPTGIENLLNQIPDKYFLNQNYPNPFNPVTKIKYGLPKSGEVKIEVYNIIGQKVANLLNEFKSAGYHEISFDGSNLPSGVYFYRIQTKGFNNVKKMILIK
jgi:hypothetical protein